MYLLSTGKQRAMKNSRVTVQSQTILAFSSWSVNLRVADLLTTNFTSWSATALPQPQSFEEGISGIFGGDLTFGGDWDAGANPFGDPPGLYPRDDLPQSKFYENVTDNTYYSFPYMRLRTTQNGGTVEGKVAFSCSGHNQGPFTMPSGSV